MKKYKITNLLIALFTLGVASFSYAQVDDLYYNPSTDAGYNTTSSYDDEYEDDYGYDDEEYDYADDDRYEEDDRYDYYYSSRIRRFHRPYYGFSYFDPVYVDRGFYDPFYSPGVNVYIYSSPYSYSSWRRANRWNNSYNPYGARYNSFGYGFSNTNIFVYGSPYSNYNRYGSYNNYGYNNYGYNSYGGGGYGYGGGGYCGPAWSNPLGFTSNSSGASDADVYYGTRRRGTGNAPNASSPRQNNINSPRDVTQTSKSRNNVRGADTPAKDVTKNNPRSRNDVYDAGASSRGKVDRSKTTLDGSRSSDYKPSTSTKRSSTKRGSIYNGTRTNPSTSKSRGNTSTRRGNNSSTRSKNSTSTRRNNTSTRSNTTRPKSNNSISPSRSNRSSSTRSSSKRSTTRSAPSRSSSKSSPKAKRGN